MDANALQQRIGEMQIQAHALGQRYAAFIMMFNAAAQLNDAKDMDNVREQVHGVIDNILDTNAQIFMLTRHLIAAQAAPTPPPPAPPGTPPWK